MKSRGVLGWLGSLLGGATTESPTASPSNLGPNVSTQRVGDMKASRVDLFVDEDFPAGYRAKVIAVLHADTAVSRAWALSVHSPERGHELMLAVESLGNAGETIPRLLARFSRFEGPPIAIAVARNPTNEPFYDRRAMPDAPTPQLVEVLPDDPCPGCGHPIGDHTLLARGRLSGDRLTEVSEGWMTCPVPGCTCNMPWRPTPEEMG